MAFVCYFENSKGTSMKPIAWYDPSNGMVSTDQDCPLFTPLGQVWGLYLKEEAKDEPWSPVSIGVDVTKEGAHVVGIYALDNDTSQIFYAKYHYAKDRHAPQRKWVGLTDEEIWETISRIGTSDSDVNPYAKLADARAIEAKLKEKNT
jgi:hypothetical protein